jgi:septum site-determining protein MinC
MEIERSTDPYENAPAISPPAPAVPSKKSPSLAAAAAAASRRVIPFDLKGTMAPLTVLRLKSLDLALIERHLRTKIAQLPQMFLNAPVLLDLSALDGGGVGLAFDDLVRALRACKLVPVAVSNIADELIERAAAAGLGIIHPGAAKTRGDDDREPERGEPHGGQGNETLIAASATPAQAPAPASASAPAPSSTRPAAPAHHAGPTVVTQPVRSGQVIYAQNADLVVLAPVNPGAQVIADGHIHIYAPLRGRAVAGVQGLLGARIFCQRLEAELVAISGAYIMAEDIPADRRGKPAQIHLEAGECRITAL